MSTTAIAIIIVLTALLSIAVTGLIFYKVAQTYFDNQQKQQLLQMKADERREMQRVTAPIRLQAYERMALFLERMGPDSLVLRCYQPGMELRALQGAMTTSIRDEWEHNLSQQVYLSAGLWARIREAKDEMINLVNSSAVSLAESSDPTRLAATIFASAAGRSPVAGALEAMHNELNELFG